MKDAHNDFYVQHHMVDHKPAGELELPVSLLDGIMVIIRYQNHIHCLIFLLAWNNHATLLGRGEDSIPLQGPFHRICHPTKRRR
jgi:hypothetical protein